MTRKSFARRQATSFNVQRERERLYELFARSQIFRLSAMFRAVRGAVREWKR